MKELITYIAKSLVDRPELVSVAEVLGDHTIVLELTVAKEDLGNEGHWQARQNSYGYADYLECCLLQNEKTYCS